MIVVNKHLNSDMSLDTQLELRRYFIAATNAEATSAPCPSLPAVRLLYSLLPSQQESSW
jgi:hypothetical protein